MNDEEILKNNILIVKFIGCTLSKESTLNHVTKWSGDFEPLNGKLNFPYNLKFHSSWDWLMPVVEKIESIYDEHEGYYGVYISSNGCVIQGTKLHKAIKDPKYGGVYFSESHLKDKISSTYNEVTQFIKWYNENKKV